MERFRISSEVAEALARGGPVVALETSLVAHGLPAPDNLDAARRCAAAIRAAGAVPAAIGLISGEIVVGASESELARLGDPDRRAAKAGARDLAPLLAARRDAGTTVSATAAIAARAGIRLFATGGIGGVHRIPAGAPPRGASDVSADLGELARSPVCVVSAGPKAILDLAATAEALETLGIPVIGYRTGELPAFFTDGSGVRLEHRVETAGEVAELLRLQWVWLGRREGVLLAVAPPDPLPRAEVEAAIEGALAGAARAGVTGPAVTPWLLAAVAEATQGRSRRANLALLTRNAAVAAEVAVALARPG
jgi:pseudouridine-5'-phosphate glycosidase